MTVAQILQIYRQRLLKKYDAVEVRAIVNAVFEHVLQLSTLKLEMSRFQLLSINQKEVLESYLERLLNNEPVQYVLGTAYFMGMKLNVNNATLIPRPETEELVRWIADEYGENFNGSILDVGTGSGCIALALKKMLPKSIVFACDVSMPALNMAQQNAIEQHLSINFFHCNVLEVCSPKVSFDIVVSNPPYIPANEANEMDKNVLNFEPHTALFVPNDRTLIFYEAIANQCKNGWLKNGGKVFFETHCKKAKEVADLLLSFNFCNMLIKKDFFGKERMVQAKLFT